MGFPPSVYNVPYQYIGYWKPCPEETGKFGELDSGTLGNYYNIHNKKAVGIHG
jgi:hypothetical protein